MQLSTQQINFFNTFGYLVVRGLLSPAEVERITDAFEWTMQNWGGGHDHDGSKRTMIAGPIEHTPELCALMDHPGVLELIGGVTGVDFNYCGGDGNYYTSDTGWHPDGNYGQLWATKTAFYLDPLRRDSGCLRVIPGSHRPDHFVRKNKINFKDSQTLFGVAPEDFPGQISLESDPGDVVIFNHELYHASFGGSQRRRMFTMNYTRRAKTPADKELLKNYFSQHTPGAGGIDTSAGMYFPTLIDTADAARMEHMRQPIEKHDEMFPQYARSIGTREPYRGNIRNKTKATLITPNSMLEPELPESITRLLNQPSEVLAAVTRPPCLTYERSPVEWESTDWGQFATERADLFDWDTVGAQFDREAYWRDGYAILKGVMTPQAINDWTSALKQSQRRNDALLDSNWAEIDWPGLGRIPPKKKLSPDDIARARGNSQKVPQKNDKAGVLTLRHHSVFAEYFPAGHVPYLMNILTHPQMLALQRLCLESEDIYFDHNQLLTRAPGYDGGGWHCHSIGAGYDDDGPASLDEYRHQPNSNLTLCYPQGFAAANDSGLKLIRGSHLFRDTTHCRGATDEEVHSNWLRDKVHPVTGQPLAIEPLDLPPGSVICCLSHAAHGVSPKDSDSPLTRWCSLYCYKTTDKRNGLVQPAHGIPLVWALKAQRGELPDVLVEIFRPSYDRVLTGGRTRFDQL